MKGLKLSSNGWIVLASTIIYISILTMMFEYVISREFPVFLQLVSLFLTLIYTVFQLKVIGAYFINLFTKEKEKEKEV